MGPYCEDLIHITKQTHDEFIFLLEWRIVTLIYCTSTLLDTRWMDEVVPVLGNGEWEKDVRKGVREWRTSDDYSMAIFIGVDFWI